ncbi:MAG: SRPBCC family protein [Deltaproteobacteria bacterium]|nr:SRPBCC family protein [Deltaproteobacteria bacterium]
MACIEKSIDVGVPAWVAYNQWTQFETFPEFMEGVEAVAQLDDRRLRWRALIGGAREEWEAEITEQIPDQRIAWRSTSGATNAGVVTFHRLDDRRCRIMLQLEYEPLSWSETLGDLLGFVSRRVEGDLERFREFIEQRRVPTGAWRGEIAAPHEPG